MTIRLFFVAPLLLYGNTMMAAQTLVAKPTTVEGRVAALLAVRNKAAADHNHLYGVCYPGVSAPSDQPAGQPAVKSQAVSVATKTFFGGSIVSVGYSSFSDQGSPVASPDEREKLSVGSSASSMDDLLAVFGPQRPPIGASAGPRPKMIFTAQAIAKRVAAQGTQVAGAPAPVYSVQKEDTPMPPVVSNHGMIIDSTATVVTVSGPMPPVPADHLAIPVATSGPSSNTTCAPADSTVGVPLSSAHPSIPVASVALVGNPLVRDPFFDNLSAQSLADIMNKIEELDDEIKKLSDEIQKLEGEIKKEKPLGIERALNERIRLCSIVSSKIQNFICLKKFIEKNCSWVADGLLRPSPLHVTSLHIAAAGIERFDEQWIHNLWASGVTPSLIQAGQARLREEHIKKIKALNKPEPTVIVPGSPQDFRAAAARRAPLANPTHRRPMRIFTFNPRAVVAYSPTVQSQQADVQQQLPPPTPACAVPAVAPQVVHAGAAAVTSALPAAGAPRVVADSSQVVASSQQA